MKSDVKKILPNFFYFPFCQIKNEGNLQEKEYSEWGKYSGRSDHFVRIWGEVGEKVGIFSYAYGDQEKWAAQLKTFVNR